MADVTPRFLYNNYVPACPIITSAHTINGTSNTGFPTTFLRDQLISKAWRSPTGWNIVAGFNDKIDITGPASVTATIAPGNYATGALLAVAVQAALTAAVANAWTVVYNSTPNRFTFTGTSAFSFKFASGANAAISAKQELGFIGDTVSGTSRGSNNDVFHSREFLTFDLGTVRAITAFALTGHNATTATITLYGNAADVWTAPSVTLAITPATVAIAYQSTQNYRYWRVVIDDTSNTDAYTKVGNVFLGDYFQPAIAYEYGFAISRNEYTSIVYADQGANYADIKQGQRTWGLGFPVMSLTDYFLFDTMRATLKIGKAFYFGFDPQNNPPDIVYGFLTSPIKLTNIPAYPATLWRADAEFTEAVG